MELQSRTAELEQALEAWQGRVPQFVVGLRSALGCDGALNDELVEVLAFIIRPAGELVSCYVMTPTALTLFELNRAGDSLTVTVPLYRLRRVAESMIGGVCKVTFEIDADRSVLSGRALEDGSLIGTLSPTVYDLVATSDAETAALRAFARSVRATILGL